MSRLSRRFPAGLALAGLLLAAATGDGQPLPKPMPPLPETPRATQPPVPTTVEDLLARLEKLRKQREDLDKEEKAVTTQLRAALAKQRDRLAKLGVTDPAQPEPGAPLSGPALPGLSPAPIGPGSPLPPPGSPPAFPTAPR